MNTRDGDRVIRFIETLGRVTKGRDAGELLVMRPWQRALIRDLVERPYRRALVGLPRKNGKSALGAALALYGLLADGEAGAEVYSLAADREQARIVFGMARRMVELEPALTARLRVLRNEIRDKQTGSSYRVLSSEAYTKEGSSPSLIIFDEVHAQPNDELWNVFSLAMGAREHPLMLGISTAGAKTDAMGRDSLCYQLWHYGRGVVSGETDDRDFFYRWWGAEDGEDYLDSEVWRSANPALGDFLFMEDMAAAARVTPENEFRTKRLNQWTSTADAWLPRGTWAACEERRAVPNGANVVLAFDGSFNNDSTALVVAEIGERPHLDVVAAWERLPFVGPEWRVPILDVEEAIRDACRRWQVREIACDPFRWARTYQILSAEGLPIVEFPQSLQRMVPATQRFYEASVNRALTHSGDGRLTRHIDNCVLRVDQRGSRVMKETRNSKRRIDLAVAAIMAVDRAFVFGNTYPALESIW